MKITIPAVILVLLAAGLAWEPAKAAVSEQEAGRLKSTLTPMGAERPGNAAGTIPPWTGGYTTPVAGYREGAPRPDPFAAEKPLFAITAQNFRKFANALPEGAKLLFEKYPDYRMDVYRTHRSAAAPTWIYDNIFLNATRAHAAPEGLAYGIEGAAGGIPFPIPKSGYEVLWNHLLAFWGAAREARVKTFIASADGTVELATSYKEIADFPYYYRDATPASYDGYYFKTLHIEDGPPEKVGESYLNLQPINTARYKFMAWRLLPGEHRVRKAPSLSYDIPDPDASGFVSLDEYYMFFGGLDHYEFKLLGKQELYVPYNNNRLYTRSTQEIMGPQHANPNDLRYELHRVWVVEGTLLPGKHDVVSRRRLYFDEDTWFAVYSDSWDNDGKFWKFGHATMYLMPEVPAVILGSQFVYDLELGGYAYGFALNGEDAEYRVTIPHPTTTFTPDYLSSHAIR